MIKDIKFSGYTAVPSDYECQDGQLAMSLNLVNDDGHIVAVEPPVEIAELSALKPVKLVRIHGDRLVVVSGGDSASVWFLPPLDNRTYDAPVSIGHVSDVVNISTVGNTLILHTPDSMLYYLWKDGEYISLGSSLPDIQLSFGLIGHPRLWSRSGGDGDITLSTDIKYDWSPEGSGTFNDADKSMITGKVMAALNRFVREQTIDKGRFCFPFFVRTALRMYDGSLVCHSAPVLMCPSTLDGPFVTFTPPLVQNGEYGIFHSNIFLVAADLDYTWVNYKEPASPYSPDPLAPWKDLIRSVDVFISAPIYSYDQDGDIEGFYSSLMHRSRCIGRLPNNASAPENEIVEDAFRSYVDADNDVKSHYSEWTFRRLIQMYFGFMGDGSSTMLKLAVKPDETLSGNIRECANYYLLHSIPIDNIAHSGRRVIPIAEDYLQSLTSREVMTDDYLSHDSLAADFSQEYNGRLNLAGIRRKLFPGFHPAAMFAYCDRLVAQFQVETDRITVRSGSVSDKVTVTIYVRENGEVRKLVAETPDRFLAPWLSPNYTAPLSWGTWLFYPNVNAFRADISSSSYSRPLSVSLRPHDFLNGAYAIFPFNSTRVSGNEAPPEGAKEANVAVEEPGKLYTSEINNPFFFPLSGRNTVGAGKILGVATAAKALSQGQFGQFPLYAFTDQGVWAMQVSSTGTYSACQPITRDVCINPRGITQIDSAVLFPTSRGIMLISGSQTQCITDAINAKMPFDVLQLPAMSKLHAMLDHGVDTCLPTAPFLDFISSCGMLYDYVHQRVIVYNPDFTYAYLFSLKSKEWGMMHSNIDTGINSYPEALAVDSDGALLNFSTIDSMPTKGLFITRPIKLETPDVLKTIDTIIIRGRFRKDHVKTVLYGSRDLINWHLVWSSKDHFLRGFRGSPYKYFRLACITSLAQDESIFGATLQFTPRQTNQPR